MKTKLLPGNEPLRACPALPAPGFTLALLILGASIWTLSIEVRAQTANAEEYTFTTLAWPTEPGAGAIDGPGSRARFNGPSGVAVDGTGNVYVVERWNYTIQKISPAGEVTTLAGLAGEYGRADGTGSLARFGNPDGGPDGGVAADMAGNVFVADTYNHTIRKINQKGEVMTLAGRAGTSGNVDGTGSAARFKWPEGIAVDSTGNVYVADTSNHTIREISPAGAGTTVAGSATEWPQGGSTDGTGSVARFKIPRNKLRHECSGFMLHLRCSGDLPSLGTTKIKDNPGH